MTDVSVDVKKIHPAAEELDQESRANVQCPVVGCLKVFQQPSALRFHLVKLHKLILNESDSRLAQKCKSDKKTTYEFYCPESNCKFSVQQFFQTFKKLKQHYKRVHGQKTFSCSICGEKFGVSYDLRRHYSRCCQKSWCMSCRTCFEDGESLARHCSATGHSATLHNGTVPEEPSNSNSKLTSACSREKFHSESTERHVTSTPCFALERQSTLSLLPPDEIIHSSISTPQTSMKTVENNSASAVETKLLSIDHSNTRSRNMKTESSVCRGILFEKQEQKVKQERKIAPKPVLPTSDFVIIPTSTATLILYQTTKNPSKTAFKKLAPKSSVADLPSMAQHTVGNFNSCPTRKSKSISGRFVKKSKSASSQATQTQRRKIKVAETQTTEEYETKKAFLKQFSGPEVSPRVKVKRLNRNVQSTQTQTSRSLTKRQKIQTLEMQDGSSNSASKAVKIVCDEWPDFTHNETQTMDFLQELCMAESSSTQTLESYLFDCLSSDDVGGNYSTIGSQLLNSVMLPLSENCRKEMQNGSNTNMSELVFSSEISNIANLEVGNNEQSVVYPYQDLLSASEIASAVNNDDSSSEQKTPSAQTQTTKSDLISDFLTAASQTNDFDDIMSINTETQTADDDLFAQFWSHMETQTTDEFLTDFGFSDIETQTTWILGHSPLVHDVPHGYGGSMHRDIASMDMETQTYFQ